MLRRRTMLKAPCFALGGILLLLLAASGETAGGKTQDDSSRRRRQSTLPAAKNVNGTFDRTLTGNTGPDLDPVRVCDRNGRSLRIKTYECSLPMQLSNGTYTLINASHLATMIDNVIMTREVLCNSSEGNPVICVTPTLQDPDQQQSLFVLQVIGITVDIASCVLYIGTFVVFSDMRTIFGKLVINLIVVILFGDVFYLMSLSAPEEDLSTEQYCEATAIVTHFLFLARFAWMTVLSTYIAKTFYSAWQMQQPVRDKKKHCTSLLLGMSVGYGVPGAFVVLCICVNYTVDNSIRYGRTLYGTCWIFDQFAINLAYVAPIAISILINLLLSIFSIGVLIRVRKNAVAKKTQAFRRLFQDCRVVFGIFSIMGVTWIFGFLALSDDVMSWAWYPFVILSTSQAATLAIAFLAKKDVFDFYSAKLSSWSSTIRQSFRRGLSSQSRSASTSGGRTPPSVEQLQVKNLQVKTPSNIESGSFTQSNESSQDSMKDRGSTSTDGLPSPSATSTQAMVVVLAE